MYTFQIVALSVVSYRFVTRNHLTEQLATDANIAATEKAVPRKQHFNQS
jgi:hypothetical protein